MTSPQELIFNSQTIFYAIWIVIFGIRNLVIIKVYSKKASEDSDLDEIHPKYQFQFLQLFTIYFKTTESDSSDLVGLKKQANLANMVWLIYTVLTIVILFYCKQLSSDPEFWKQRKQNVKLEQGYFNEAPDSFKTVGKTNEERRDLGIVHLPDIMFLKKTSTVEKQEWINTETFGHAYYHQTKIIYSKNNKWNREHDIFFHYESPIIEQITSNAEMINDSLVIGYTFNRKPISEFEFDSIMAIWGFYQ